MSYRKLLGVGFAVAATLVSTLNVATAADFPERAITIVVPFPPGGTSDLMGRIMAKGMGNRLGVPVVVDNKGGGGTLIGSQHVARSEPNGYTLLLAATPHAINQSLYKNIPYDTLKDFRTVAYLSETPLVLAVPASSDINNLQELVAKIKAGETTYSSSGVGGSPHLATALLLKEIGAEATHVPYRGSNPSVMDLAAGRVDFSFDTLYLIMSQVETGKLRPIAQTMKERHPRLTELATVSEQGLPDYDVTSWFSLAVPSGTPDDVVNKLNGVINETLKDPEVMEFLAAQGMVILGGSADEAQARLVREMDTWKEAVEVSGATIE